MKRLNQDIRTDDVTDVTISRIDARLDALELAVAALGGGNSVAVVADFGASFTHFTQTVVTGQTWVTALSKINPIPTGTNPTELAVLQFSCAITDLVVGDGFTLSVYTPAKAKGTYTFNCIGV